MTIAHETLKTLDEVLEQEQEPSFRWHLGASLIGDSCSRKLWYTFRWAKQVRHKGRILRLFQRGHLEEARFIEWLRKTGATIWEKDDNGNQYRMLAHSGHFGGSLDGVGRNLPDLPKGTIFLTEFKTHNEKSFSQLLTKGVKESKPQHYSQMQIYMRAYSFEWGLYCAINKNTDEVYLELVYKDYVHADQQLERAGMIIGMQEPPPRISENPSWYLCKFCDFHSICHTNIAPAKNCRTCTHITPVDNGGWHCAYHDTYFYKPEDDQSVEASPTFNGCDMHVYNPNLLNREGFVYVGGDTHENYAEYKLADGRTIKQGPKHLMSKELCNTDIIKKTQ